ncbi:MAG: response regulator transcription factor, partial [Verrucomicrobiaceae bacterium]
MIKIAIVEDNATTREVLRSVIEECPDYACVGVFGTAEEALLRLPKRLPDVVLMDIQLPNMSGIECVSQLKKMFPQMLVIMVTVYEDPDRVFSALRAGASGYLLKRSAPEGIIGAIREVSGGGGPMSGEIARKVIEYFGRQNTSAPEVDNLTSREKEVLDLV